MQIVENTNDGMYNWTDSTRKSSSDTSLRNIIEEPISAGA